MNAVLKNMRKKLMLQTPIDSECSEFYEKYYLMKFDKDLDSSILFESVAKGVFSKKIFIYLLKTASAKALPVILFQYWN